MATRKLTAVEEQAARAMARARLVGGERPSSVVAAVRSWLVARGWKPGSARTRAGIVVTELVDELESSPKPRKSKSSLYEAWRLPGGEWTEGEISASEAKAVGATIKVKGLAREFHVTFESEEGRRLYPWKLRENQPVGTLGAVDNFVLAGEFSTMTAARAEAHMLARGGTS